MAWLTAGVVGARASSGREDEAIHPTNARSREVYRVLPPTLPTTFADCATDRRARESACVCVRVRAHVSVSVREDLQKRRNKNYARVTTRVSSPASFTVLVL